MKALGNWTIWVLLSISALFAQTTTHEKPKTQDTPIPTAMSAGVEGAVYIGGATLGSVSQFVRGDQVWRTDLSKDPRAQVLSLAQSPDGTIVAAGSQKNGGFVAKLKPTGEVISTESLPAAPRAIAVDSAGAIYLGGDGFLAKRRADLSVVSNIDPGGSVTGLAGDSTGGIYAAIKASRGSVSKLAGDGSGWLWQTDLGPSEPAAVAVDRFGAIYVAGSTSSQAFITRNPSQPQLNGVSDGFMAKLLPSGEVVWSTFTGGSGADAVTVIGFDWTDTLLLGGTTNSVDFPGADTNSTGMGQQGFIAWIDAGGQVTRSMRPNRSAQSHIVGIAFDSDGAMNVAGIVDGDTPAASFRRFELAPFRAKTTSLLKPRTVTVPTVTTQPTDQTTTIGGSVTFSMAAEFPTLVTYNVIDNVDWQVSGDNGVTWGGSDTLATKSRGSSFCCSGQGSTTVTTSLGYSNLPASADGYLVRVSMNSGALISNSAKIIVSYTPAPTSVVLTGSNQQGLLNQSYGTLQAKILDQAGAPLSGQQVTLTVTPGSSGASGTLTGGSPQTLTTGSDGTISPGVLTANGTTGSFTINGTISGSTLTFAFHFTNVIAKYNFLHPGEAPLAVKGTQLFKINNHGVAAGVYFDANGVGHGVTYDGSTYTNLPDASAYGTFPQGINDNGVIAGYYLDSSNVRHGFVLNGTTYTTVDAPGKNTTTLTGISNNGVMSGFSTPSPYGFTYDGTNFKDIDHTIGVFDEVNQSTLTSVNGISNTGTIVGTARFTVYDAVLNGVYSMGFTIAGNKELFYRFPGTTLESDHGQTITTVPTLALGINDNGLIVGRWGSNGAANPNIKGFTNDGVSYINFIDPLSANGTFLNGVNNAGYISGYYVDSNSVSHPLILTPLNIAAASGDGQSTGLGLPFSSPLQVRVTYAYNGAPASGVTVTFTAPGSGASATFSNSGQVTTDANGYASLTATANSVDGSYTVTAVATGGATGTAAFNLTNGRGFQTITFGPLANQGITTPPFTISATASSGLTVSFTSTTTAVCTVSGSTVTLVALGTCTIQANQAGDTNFLAATPVNQSFQVTKASQTITFGSLSDQTLVTPTITVTATASSGLPVSFASMTTPVCTVSGSTVTLVAVGTCTLEATQAGNASYDAATPVDQIFQVTLATQTITFDAISSQTLAASPITVSTTASSGLPVSVISTTTTVCTISGFTVTLVAAGNCILRATQAGNGIYSAASLVTRSFQVTKTAQTITFDALSNQAYGTGPITVSATASSGLPVTFTSSTPGTCSVSGNSVTLSAVGTCTVRASQTGDATYAPGAAVTQSFQITKGSQAITFGALSAQTVNTPPFSLTATASSGLTVTFASSTTSVCTVSGSTVTLVTTGTCTIVAAQSGNSNYNAATSVTQGFQVQPAPPVITTLNKTAGDNQSAVTGQAFATSLKVTVLDQTSSTFSGAQVSFAVVAGNSGASGTFASSPTQPITTGSDGTATAPVLTANGVQGTFTVTATVASTNLSQTFTLTNSAPSIMLARSSVLEGPAAGSDSVEVVSTISWTASSNDSWLHIAASGNGNGVANFTFDANTGSTRTGTMTIGGLTFTVTQAGAGYVAAGAVTLKSSLVSPYGVATDPSATYTSRTGTGRRSRSIRFRAAPYPPLWRPD